jgi:hypothetical protein
MSYSSPNLSAERKTPLAIQAVRRPWWVHLHGTYVVGALLEHAPDCRQEEWKAWSGEERGKSWRRWRAQMELEPDGGEEMALDSAGMAPNPQ